MTEPEFQAYLQGLAQNLGGYAKLVEQLKLPYHPTTINFVALGKRTPPKALLRALGFERVVHYRPTGEST